jgi:hypothetical protein
MSQVKGYKARQRVLLRLMMSAVLLVFAAPFGVLLFFSVPATDDFCKATLAFNGVPQKDVLAITWLYFTKWSPRWLTTLLQSFVMSRADLVGDYGWLLLAVVVSSIAALCYFLHKVCRLKLGTALLAGGVFFAAWVASLPSPAEELYWLTGSTEYYLSFSTLLILLTLLCRPRRTALYLVAVVVLSIAIPAQHEIAGAFLCACLLGGAVVLRINRLSVYQWNLSFCVASLSEAVVVFSPGNALRAAQEHRHVWDVRHLPYWTAHAFYHGLSWLSHPAFLLAACCILLLSVDGREGRDAGAKPIRYLGFACVCGAFSILCEYGLVQMASGKWSPDRVVAWFSFVFWFFLVSAILTNAAEPALANISFTARLSVFFLFGAILLTSSNFRRAVEDARGPAQSWWRMGSSQLRRRGGSPRIEVPSPYPNFAMHQELQADPGCWVNRCLANYLQSERVTASDTAEGCPR